MCKGRLLILVFILSLAISAIGMIISDTVAFSEEKDVTEELNENIESTLFNMDLSDFESYFAGLDTDVNKGISLKEMVISITKGENLYTFEQLLKVISGYLFSDLTRVLPSLAAIVIIAFVLSMLNGVSGDFLNSETNQTIYIACFAVAVVTVLKLTMEVLIRVTGVISTMSKLVYAVFPPLLSICVALGGVNGSNLLKPQLASFLTIITGIVSNFVVPLFIATLLFSVVGNLSNNVKLNNFRELCMNVGSFMLKGVFGLFIGYLTISGLSMSIIDGASIKTAKFLVSNYVPILGGYLSEGLDLMMLGMVLIKNGLGIVAIVLILFTVISPLLSLVALQFGLKLVAAIVEPITDKKLGKFLSGVSDSLKLLSLSLIGTGFVFIVCVALLISAANVGV